MSWVLAFLGFALLIIFHELGHFTAAKAVGMRVERFSLFFGPALAKVRRGETEYAIGSIPLGGYVKITGMSPDEAKALTPELYARSYAGSPVWKRLVVISAGPIVNVVIAFVLLMGLFWASGRPVPGIGVGQVEAGKASAGVLQPKDLILQVTAPVKGATDQVALGQAPGLTDAQIAKRINGVRDLIATGGCGAASLGRSADGVPQVSRCAAAQPLQVQVSRAGATQTLAVTPQYDFALKRYRLGVSFDSYPTTQSIGPITASGEGVGEMWRVTRATISAIVKVVYDPRARKEVSSVVGGYETTRQSFEVDTKLAIEVLALISLSLAIINLFPFLPLDGGHIFWAIAEKLRGGRPVSTAVLERASMVGLVLVLLLFSVGLSNDIGRITSGSGFGVPSK